VYNFFSRSCPAYFVLSKKRVCYKQVTDTEQHKKEQGPVRGTALTEHRPKDEDLAQARRQWQPPNEYGTNDLGGPKEP
jgi:hypothetical protein